MGLLLEKARVLKRLNTEHVLPPTILYKDYIHITAFGLGLNVPIVSQA